MWIYELRTGRFMSDTVDRGVELLATGYSGAGPGKNNPGLQRERGVGPIPTGAYFIETSRDTEEHGPVAMPLRPIDPTDDHGRDGFLIHGDSIRNPGAASHGCIILPRPVRERISASPDRHLLVITGGI